MNVLLTCDCNMIGLSANCQEALSRALGAYYTLLNIIGVVLLIKTPYPLQYKGNYDFMYVYIMPIY